MLVKMDNIAAACREHPMKWVFVFFFVSLVFHLCILFYTIDQIPRC